MSKQDDKHSMAEDYIAQVKWDAEHPYMADGSRPDIPDWKYKPVTPEVRVTKALSTFRFILTGAYLIITGILLYQGIIKRSGGAIFMSIVLITFGLMLFFAARDAAKPKDNDIDDRL